MSIYEGGSVNNGVDWDYFDRFDAILGKYLPDHGEGDTMATQICTSVNKLVYKWYNDGDVYDNTHHMDGWLNDLSSYANWLSEFAEGASPILARIRDCWTHADYEHILKDLADAFLTDDVMAKYEASEKCGSIYKCNGAFKYKEQNDDDDEEE